MYDKTGIVEFARALHDVFGVEIISTGGTAQTLTQAGLPVTLVESITGFPEMLDGRVKTLHPHIHAAILADRDNPEHMRQLAAAGVEPIDAVAIDLYPFEQTIAKPGCTFEQAIEMIDIGGPCMIRAAAKNHRHVWVLTHPQQREQLLAFLAGKNDVDESELRERFALRAFATTKHYDHVVRNYFLERSVAAGADARGSDTGVKATPETVGVDDHDSACDATRVFVLERSRRLRYGENPHQSAAAYRDADQSPNPFSLDLGLDAPEMSFNNYVDADAAFSLCAELTRGGDEAGRTFGGSTRAAKVACFIKHTNACGVGVADDPIEAYRRAYLGDPNAAMGGILAVNFPVDADVATAVMETFARFGKPLKAAGHPHPPGGFFVEVWIAPYFDDEAVEVIRGQAAPTAARPEPPKKSWGQRVRLFAIGSGLTRLDDERTEIKAISGGFLLQSPDLVGLNEHEWTVVTRRRPSEAELADLKLAWLICKHTKSNAISICRDGMLIGNGAGQMSRVMSCRIAAWLAQENGHGALLAGAAAASDAFFPFRDGVDQLIDAGVTAIIQPGGSKRDDEAIAACDERDVAMIFTGTRHFRH